jgi:predicted alpha/beta superfamily hydrolase
MDNTQNIIVAGIKKKCLFLLCVFVTACSFGQYKLRIEVTVPAGTPENDPVFMAGSFNNWSAADTAFNLSPQGDHLFLDAKNVPGGTYELKFTRGSWNTVEAGAEGADIQNRNIMLTSDTVIRYSIVSWKDHFPAIPKKHTASANVHIMDTAFFMPQLNSYRRIWIYLPQGYGSSTKRYPVLYMHDGQNVFDAFTSGFGEWGVDEIVDSLVTAGNPAAVVVGIDNGPERINEYNPYDFEKFGKGKGDEYVQFIIKSLKPYIDKHYRTLPGKENTFIAGSSMGGLISYYAALRYPNVFGRAGVFSPSFWTAPQVLALTDSLAPQSSGMFFFYMGGLEGEEMTGKMNEVIFRLGSSSKALLYTVVDPEGQHNEAAWRKWFPEFYLWVNSNGLNHIIR